MKLIEVELRNFLSHSNTLVRFTDGINVITGPNGAGKSSIIDGIKYSIFGRRERGRGSLQEELIKKGSRDMSVRTTFIMGGHTYEIFRSVSLGRGGAKPTVAYLKRNGQTIASTVSGVEQQLEIELGIKSDVVLNSLFVGQGEMDSLISLSKAERQKLFGQILALDLLSEASDAIRDPIRRIDGILEESSGLSEELVQLRGNLVTESSKNSTLKGEVEELNSRLSSVSSQVEEIEERIRILNAGIAALQQQKKELEAKRLKRVEVNQEIQKIQHEIHTISERIERNSAKVDQKLLSMRDKIILAIRDLGELSRARSDLDSLERQLGRFEEWKQKLQDLQPVRDRYLLLTSKKETLLKEDDGIREAAASHANSLKTIRSLESEIKGLEDQFLNLSAKIIRDTGISGFSDQEVNQRISELGAELRSLEDQLTREAGLILGLESKLLEIREHRSIVSGKNTCPVCGQPLTSDHMNELMKGWLEQESRIGLELEERRRLQDELRERIRATKWVRDYFHSKSFNEARNLITRIENRKRDLDAERRKAEESEGSFRRHAEILSEIGGIEQEIMSLSEGNDAWEQLDSNLKGFDVEDARSRKAGLSQRIREISEQISEVERSSGFRIEPSLMVRIQENDALYSEISRLESDRKKAAGILEGYRSNIESLEKDIQSLEESIVPLDELQRKLNEMVQERNSLREFEKTIRTDLQTKQANFQVSNQRIEDTQKQISVIEGKLRRRELMRVRRETLEKIRRCLGRDGIQRAIRQEAAEYISRKVHDYVSAFSLGVADVKVSDDMDIEVSMGDHTENIAMLSGGERTALSVALRLALARYLAENVNTILMDEPTNFLDSERRDNLRDILKTAFGKDRISPQLIMVTHHHELASAANVAYSIVKRDGTSYLENFF